MSNVIQINKTLANSDSIFANSFETWKNTFNSKKIIEFRENLHVGELKKHVLECSLQLRCEKETRKCLNGWFICVWSYLFASHRRGGNEKILLSAVSSLKNLRRQVEKRKNERGKREGCCTWIIMIPMHRQRPARNRRTQCESHERVMRKCKGIKTRAKGASLAI